MRQTSEECPLFFSVLSTPYCPLFLYLRIAQSSGWDRQVRRGWHRNSSWDVHLLKCPLNQFEGGTNQKCISLQCLCMSVSMYNMCACVSMYNMCECLCIICVHVSMYNMCLCVSMYSMCTCVSMYNMCTCVSMYNMCACVSMYNMCECLSKICVHVCVGGCAFVNLPDGVTECLWDLWHLRVKLKLGFRV